MRRQYIFRRQLKISKDIKNEMNMKKIFSRFLNYLVRALFLINIIWSMRFFIKIGIPQNYFYYTYYLAWTID